MRSISNTDFMLPIRTVSEMNDRGHWGARVRRKHLQQAEVAAAMQNNLKGRKVQLPCVVKLTRVGVRRMDGDNAQSSLKFVRDAIAQKLGADDGSDLIKWEYAQIHGAKEYGVKVSIQSLTD